MSRRVVWSRAALADIRQQLHYIAADNPNAARRVANALRTCGLALGEMATGRPGRIIGTYEKTVARLPYIIAYRLDEIADEERVVILRVIHTSRDWSPEQWPS